MPAAPFAPEFTLYGQKAVILIFNKAEEDHADLFPAEGGEKIGDFHFLVGDQCYPAWLFGGFIYGESAAFLCSFFAATENAFSPKAEMPAAGCAAICVFRNPLEYGHIYNCR